MTDSSGVTSGSDPDGGIDGRDRREITHSLAGGPRPGLRRVATEEAFSTKDVADELGKVATSPTESLDLSLVKAIYGGGRSSALLGRLLDLEEERLADMDANAVSVQLLSLTAPGVQMFDADSATDLASKANDQLAAVIGRHPERFGGLATIAPQSPRRAVVEMERAMGELKLNGFVINSHTNNEYLDDPKFWPILEAAEGLGACIYLHPRSPSDGFSAPLRHYGVNAVWGFATETGTHAVRMIMSGLFDRFPDLRFCLGHMGEGVHFWFWRLDFLQASLQRSGAGVRLALTPSEYFKRNFVITTSGQESHLALDYSIKALGADRVLWAVDYPYQPTASAVAFLDSAPISEEDREKVYHLNAERVFRLPSA